MGAYFVGRSLWNNFVATGDNDEDDDDAAPSLSRQQVDRRLQACQQEARALYSSIAPAVHKAVLQATPGSAARSQLRDARHKQDKAAQHEAWHAIRVATWTRLVVNAYSQSILLCMVWTHVHRIEQNALAQNGDTSAIVSTQWCRAFIDHGVVQGILHPVRAVVQRVLASRDEWDCFAPTAALHMTADKVEQTLHRICQECNPASSTDDDAADAISVNPLCWWTNLAAAATNDTTKVEAEVLDLWESPLAQQALQECLSCTLQTILRQLRTSLFQQDPERPVAKVVAELKSHDGSDWEASWSQWVALPTVYALGRVVLLDGCKET